MKETLDRTSWQPVKITLGEINKLARNNAQLRITDQYKKNLEELFLLRNPKYRFDKNYQPELLKFFKKQGLSTADRQGSWFYYPWANQIVHFLPAKMHQELRTGRN